MSRLITIVEGISKCVCCDKVYFFFAWEEGRYVAYPFYSQEEALAFLKNLFCSSPPQMLEEDYFGFCKIILQSKLPVQAPRKERIHEFHLHHDGSAKVTRGLRLAFALLEANNIPVV